MNELALEKVAQLKKWVDESDNIVFFGGAGVSTESGIPDFRSPDGLYHQKYDVPPETLLSHSYYVSHPDKFFDFYHNKILKPGAAAKPNAAHLKLAEWERQGKCRAVVTQNIDGLHQMAGSKKVFELHGSVLRNYCEKCGKFFDLDFVMNTEGIPYCDACGGRVKPDVVLYEEGLDQQTIRGAVDAIAEADILIIGGTSLVVYPAAGLIDYYRGHKLVLVNKSETSRDRQADLAIHESIGEVFSRL